MGVSLLALALGIPFVFYKYLTVSSLPYKFIPLSPYSLLCGHCGVTPLVVDMQITPHLLVTGLSGQGKSKMLRVMLLNIRGADIVICNAFRNDFLGVNALFINGCYNVKTYIKNIVSNLYKRDKPLYIVLEELGTIRDKECIKYITELLCVARHYNIYIIGVIQIATKEELKYKSYFNARLSFRQLDSSAYRVAVCSTPKHALSKRQFLLLTDDLQEGYTYII